MKATMVNGWVEVPYGGPESATVELSVEPDVWLPAFLDYDTNGQRVAKVRPPVLLRTAQVWLRVDGSVSTLGWLAI